MNTLSTARRTAEEAFSADPSDANLKALQAAGKAEMDAVLAAFDARNAEVTEEAAPVEPSVQVVAWPAAPAFAAWFVALLDQNLECTDTDAFERKAYRGHISYSLSMTDGYYAPEDFDRWVGGFRIDPAGALYYGNDSRSEMAPMVNDYQAKFRA